MRPGTVLVPPPLRLAIVAGLLVALGCQSQRDTGTGGTAAGPSAASADPPTSTVASAATVPALFTETRIGENFKQATHMVIAPDGRIFVAEQAGVVRVVKNDVVLSAPFVTIPPADIDASGSRGLMGITVSPSFATDRYVYLAYTRKSPLNNRIIRVRASTANPDVAETSGGAPVISASFDLSPQGGSAHNSMAMRFSNGLLYISTGDNGTPANAQNVDHSAGKILRMNLDLTPATGNPYAAVSSANNWKKRLWARGMRNPWTMAVHPTSGLLYVSDVGSFEGTGGTPNTDGVPREEINHVLNTASRTSELDYGWPNTEGAGANIIHTYRNAPGEDVVPSDCAVVGGSFYAPNTTAFPSTPKFPTSYNGAYFFGDHCAGTIKYLPAAQQAPQTLNGNPPANSARTPTTFATNVIVGMVQLEASPNGALYYLTRAIVRPRDPNVNGILIKVAYAGTAVPQTCTLTAPANGSRLTAPANVTLTADAVDTAVGIAKVEFFSTNSNLPGAVQQKLGEDTSPPYALPANDLGENAYRLVVRCTNTQGGFKDSDPITITVNGPTGVIDNPVSSLTYDAGDTINFSGSAFDVEDGTIPASRYLWIIELGHGIGEGAHYHEAQRLEGVTGGSFVTSRNEELDPNTFYRINLQVQDAAGIYHTAERDIFPNKTNATVTTSPAGLFVGVDGTDRVGPITFQSVVGIERVLDAPASQNLNGRRYQFASWSNGGPAIQTWLVPNGNPTITASYQDVGPTWQSQDIGAVGAPGSFIDGGSTLTVGGAGTDIYGTADEGHFAYRTFTGDVTIVARVATLQANNVWSKAGVMIRDGLTPGARNVFALTSPTATNKFRLQSRATANGSTVSAQSTANSAVPSFLRIVRTGNSFTGAHASAATGPWTTIATVTVTMGATVQVGLAATSHVDATAGNAVFDNVSITTPAPPSAPGGLTATAGNGQVALGWTAASGATSYTVKRATVSGGPYTNVLTGVTATTATNTGLNNGTTYHYVVSASNGNGESGNSNQASATPQLPPPPPVPASLTATAGNAQVNLSWAASSGATGYNIKRATISGGPYTTIVANHGSTSRSDTAVANGTTYYYVVSALGVGGESANSSEASATPVAPPAPNPPGNLQASAGNAQVSLTWTAAAGATSYTLKRSTSSGDGYINVASGLTGTSHSNTGLANGTTYFYVVTAVNAGGESGNSNEAAATPQLPPPPAAPTNLQATAGNAQVGLTWTASAGASSYTVKRATVNGGPYTNVATGVTGTSSSNTGLSNGTTYYYVVSATGVGGEGANSTQVQATPTAPVVTWTSVTVGAATAGTWSESGGTHTIEGSGADIQTTADAFQFVYRSISGNATITARVQSLENTHSFVKAGVMIREGTAAGARHMLALTTATATNGNRYQYRTAVNGTTTAPGKASGQANSVIPGWVRVVRNGNNLSAFFSANGTSWTQLGTTQAFTSLPATLQIGLAVTSHANGTLATGVFNSVTITTP